MWKRKAMMGSLALLAGLAGVALLIAFSTLWLPATAEEGRPRANFTDDLSLEILQSQEFEWVVQESCPFMGCSLRFIGLSGRIDAAQAGTVRAFVRKSGESFLLMEQAVEPGTGQAFSTACAETCELPDGFSEGSYSLEFQVPENISLFTDSISYTWEGEAPLPQVYPVISPLKETFSRTEKAAFTFEFFSEDELRRVGRDLVPSEKPPQRGRWEGPNETIEVSLAGPDGNPVEAEVELRESREGAFAVALEPLRSGRAGAFTLRLTLRRGGQEFIVEDQFRWGVLALNTHKSVYLPGEEAFIGMAVLDDQGRIVCNADVALLIRAPDGTETTLSTREGTIRVSDECQVLGVTTLPDYYTTYQVKGAGIYEVVLTAVTANGERMVRDAFEVRDSVAMDVARQGPTRIYPPVPYQMTLILVANNAYKGAVTERVPSSFSILPQDGLTVTEEGGEKTLSWEVDLAEGQRTELSYTFDAPDRSPAFYLLGPLEIGGFRESRQWQIAGDALFTTLQKTVGYFVTSRGHPVTSGVNVSGNVSVQIPETSPVVRNAWVEVELYGNATPPGARRIDIYMNGVLLDSAPVTVFSEAFSQRHRVLKNATLPFSQITGPGNYSYLINVSTNLTTTSIVSTRLFLTYDYAASSPRQQKTVKFFINSSAPNIPAARNVTTTFSINLPENDVRVASAWFEITGITDGGAASNVTVSLNNTIINALTSNNTVTGLGETEGYLIVINASSTGANLYSLSGDSPTGSYSLGISPTGNEMAGYSAVLAITYLYNASSPKQLNTVEYFINSSNEDTSLTAAATTMNGFVRMKLPEASPVVKSSWIEAGGFYDNSGTGMQLNLTINGTILASTANMSNVSLMGSTASTDELSSFVYFANASSTGADPYDIVDNKNYDFSFSMGCGNSEACYGQYAKAFVTYSYSAVSSTTFLSSNTYYIANRNEELLRDTAYTQDFRIRLPVAPKVRSAHIESSVQAEDNVNMGYAVQLNASNVTFGNNTIVTTGLVFDLILVKNATSSAADLYTMASANTNYDFKYGLLTMGEDSFRVSARATLTYEYTAPDTTPPTWSSPQINTSSPVNPKDVINLSVLWQDETALRSWTFEWNATGAACNGGFSNATQAAFGGILNVSWTAQAVPAACNGTQIGWRFYANDSSGNINATSLQTFNVRAFGSLTVNLTNPDPLATKAANANSTFHVNATARCNGPAAATCGVVNGSVRYNASTQQPDRVISTAAGTSPFYVTDVYNTLTCGLLLQGEACQLNWTVNATGANGTLWLIDANFSSTNYTSEVAANDTANALVNITTILNDISFTVSFPAQGCTLGNGSLDATPDCERCAFLATDISGGTVQNRTACEGQNATLGFYEFRNTGNVNLNWTMQLNESLDTTTFRHKIALNDSGYEAGCSAGNPPPTNTTCSYVESTSSVVIQRNLPANAVQMAWAWADFTGALPLNDTAKNITHTSVES